MRVMLGSDGRTGILLSVEIDELAIAIHFPVSNKSYLLIPAKYLVSSNEIYITFIFISLNGAQ